MSKPPGTFRRPTDPPDPLQPLRAGENVAELQVEWSRIQRESSETMSLARRLRTKTIRLAARIGGTDHFLASVLRAVDDVANRCDELGQRVNNLAISLDDLARTVSEDLTQLRAETESAARIESGNPQSSLP
jgi:hypothetical protein